MRTVASQLVEGNPDFVLIKSNRVQCPGCGKSAATYRSRVDGTQKMFWHRSNQGEGTFAQPIQFRKCAGSGRVIP